MGCWDIACLACGLPCHSEKEYIEIAEETGDEYIIKETKKIIKKFGYLNQNTFLTVDNRIVRNCKETSCNIDFISPAGEKLIQVGYGDLGHDPFRGIFIHTSCWNWIKKTYNVKLKYSDLPIDMIHNDYRRMTDRPIPGINYGPITKYWTQDFDYIKMIENGDTYMIDRNNPKNIARIKKIVAQYKLKNDPKRIGPNATATFFKDDAIKIGNNKFFWIKRNGRWQEIKENIITKTFTIHNPNKKLLKYIEVMPFIGEFNKIPLFKSSVKQDKKNFIIKVIATQSRMDIFQSTLSKI